MRSLRSFRTFLFAALLAFAGAHADAAQSIVNKIKKQISSASTGTTATFSTTTGDTLAVCWADPNANVNVTDSVHGSTGWTQAGTDFTITGGLVVQCWYHENITGSGTHTVTLTTGAGTMDSAFFVWHMRGLATASYDSAVRATAEETDGSSPFTVTSGTLSQANEILITFICSSVAPTTWTVAAPFTKDLEETDDSTYWTSAGASYLSSATSAQTPSWTDSGSAGNLGLIIIGFKEAAGGGGGTQPPRTMHMKRLMGRAANDDEFLLRASR